MAQRYFLTLTRIMIALSTSTSRRWSRWSACPHSPDNVKKMAEMKGLPVHQVAIGSCTNSSYKDLMTVAAILKGKKVPPEVSLIVAPGSRQVLEMIARNGALADIIASGARIMESPMRILHRSRSGTADQRHFPENEQPEFRREVGNGIGPGISGEP